MKLYIFVMIALMCNYTICLSDVKRYGGDDMKNGTFSLTIDDGPGPHTLRILKDLDKNNVKATFFLVGDQVKLYPEIVEEIIIRGHEIGCHSMTHLDMRKDEERAIREIDECYKMLKSRLFRFPYGASTRHLREYLERKNIKAYWWAVDSLDWQRPTKWMNPTLDLMTMTKRGIVLVHEQSCYSDLDLFLKNVKKKGWKFLRLRKY